MQITVTIDITKIENFLKDKFPGRDIDAKAIAMFVRNDIEAVYGENIKYNELDGSIKDALIEFFWA